MALRCIYCGAPSEYAPARWWQRREWRVLRHVCPVPKRERRTLYDGRPRRPLRPAAPMSAASDPYRQVTQSDDPQGEA